MPVISIRTLRVFYAQHPQAEQPLLAWHDEVRRARWTCPADIKAQFRNASFVCNNRVIFNIKGNDYRLVVAVLYAVGAVLVKFIGTHAQYDKTDATTVEPQ